MSVKSRLTVLYTALTAAILLLFAVFIYLSAASDREKEFYLHLQKEAITKANVLFDAKVDAETLQTIYRQNRAVMSEVEVAIYDPGFRLLYHDAVEIDFVKETREMIDEIVEKGKIRFKQDGWQVIGLLFNFEDIPYIITAAAHDESGYAKLDSLRITLIVSWLAGIIFSFLIGWLFSRRALQPVSAMAAKAEAITATNLDLRLSEGNGKDELAELAITFNQMLDRLEGSFDAQKQFVSNIAHELRTPLTTIMGEVELALSRPRDNKAYQKALEQTLEDARKLSKLTNNLLDLAKASYDQTEINMREVRLDEVLLDARNEILKANPTFIINLVVEETPEASPLTLTGNAYLLKVAFANLIENACKFSGNLSCEVRLLLEKGQMLVQFTDQGQGIPEDDLPHIFQPFFRGKNQAGTSGSGIGLPLVEKILTLHKGRIEIVSEAGHGTRVSIFLSE